MWLSMSAPSDCGPHDTVAMPKLRGYEVLEKLGEGGMGTVWRARQWAARRDVALKVMHPAAVGSLKAQARFHREIELAAGLIHPNIVRVYDCGIDDRQVAYYTMELIEGQTLTSYAEEKQLSPSRIARLMRTICDAVQHAHHRGVIHRDLKPANILVTRDERPYVLDFGLAKALFHEADTAITYTGDLTGTPRYMSPEQAAGDGKAIDTRSDVYALGVIFYRLLTGQYPHDMSGTCQQVLARIAQHDARRPRDANPRIDRELNTLLLKALARDPQRRYSSAGQLAEDIDNYLHGEPLIARPTTVAYLVRKRVQRHRMAITVAAAISVGLLALAASSYYRERALRQQAEHARSLANRQRDLALRILNTVVDGIDEPLRDMNARDARDAALLEKTIEGFEKLFPAGDGLDVRAVHGKSTALTRSGVLAQGHGRLHDALARFDQARRIGEDLAGDPDSDSSAALVLRAQLAQVYRKLGQAALLVGDLDQATHYGDQAATIDLARVERNPQDVKASIGLAISNNLLGEVWLARQDYPRAREHLERARQLQEDPAVAAHDPGVVQANLAVTYVKLGDIELATGRLDAARDAYGHALKLQTQLPKNADPFNLVAMYVKIGDLNLRLGRPWQAGFHYDHARRQALSLLDSRPDHAQIKANLALIRLKLGRVHELMDAWESAAQWYVQARDLCQQILEVCQDHALAKYTLDAAEQRLKAIAASMEPSPGPIVAIVAGDVRDSAKDTPQSPPRDGKETHGSTVPGPIALVPPPIATSFGEADAGFVSWNGSSSGRSIAGFDHPIPEALSASPGFNTAPSASARPTGGGVSGGITGSQSRATTADAATVPEPIARTDPAAAIIAAIGMNPLATEQAIGDPGATGDPRIQTAPRATENLQARTNRTVAADPTVWIPTMPPPSRTSVFSPLIFRGLVGDGGGRPTGRPRSNRDLMNPDFMSRMTAIPELEIGLSATQTRPNATPVVSGSASVIEDNVTTGGDPNRQQSPGVRPPKQVLPPRISEEGPITAPTEPPTAFPTSGQGRNPIDLPADPPAGPIMKPTEPTAQALSITFTFDSANPSSVSVFSNFSSAAGVVSLRDPLEVGLTSRASQNLLDLSGGAASLPILLPVEAGWEPILFRDQASFDLLVLGAIENLQIDGPFDGGVLQLPPLGSTFDLGFIDDLPPVPPTTDPIDDTLNWGTPIAPPTVELNFEMDLPRLLTQPAIPEPSSAAALLAGIAGWLVSRRRR